MQLTEHIIVEPSVLYVGTPVMLLCTENPDGTTNLSVASSYWSLGRMIVIGLLNQGRTIKNLLERPDITVNFPSPDKWKSVESIADTTGMDPVPATKRHRYTYEPDKFARADLTPQPSDVVGPSRVRECALQFEGRLCKATPGAGEYCMAEVEVLRIHADPRIVVPGTQHIDPSMWQPTIYSFRHYLGVSEEVGHRANSDTAHPVRNS
ncbi:flavin reductase family protein [Glutamicibacter sp. JL.03c]|uniref:flavin reductase family protein n=1 Tax=Glutamicibacter sp. JL.03c TaxID=2984842 RepID=UPI0021F7820E|nr:flavin reductase family protein [Glutamicibacter sp. JL.03c]UYQ77277.1 flavin reductase family protein [Glutamicibacter sp. JL.03c]